MSSEKCDNNSTDNSKKVDDLVQEVSGLRIQLKEWKQELFDQFFEVIGVCVERHQQMIDRHLRNKPTVTVFTDVNTNRNSEFVPLVMGSGEDSKSNKNDNKSDQLDNWADNEDNENFYSNLIESDSEAD